MDEPFFLLFWSNSWLYFPFNELLDQSPKWIKAIGGRGREEHDPNLCLFLSFSLQAEVAPFTVEVNVHNVFSNCFSSQIPLEDRNKCKIAQSYFSFPLLFSSSPQIWKIFTVFQLQKFKTSTLIKPYSLNNDDQLKWNATISVVYQYIWEECKKHLRCLVLFSGEREVKQS